MTSAEKAAAFLAQYPGPARLRPSRIKWMLMLALGLVLTAGGGWMISSGRDGGWIVMAFFAVCAIVSAVMLLPNASWLILDEDGFTTRVMYREFRRTWRDASNFTVASVPPQGNRMVVYDDAAESGVLAGLNRAMSGRSAGFSDTYGLKDDDFAALMTQWRARALGG